MSLIRKHGAVLQAWACLDLVDSKQCNYGAFM